MPVDFVDATKLGCVKGGNIKKKRMKWQNMESWIVATRLYQREEGDICYANTKDCCTKKIPSSNSHHAKAGAKGP